MRQSVRWKCELHHSGLGQGLDELGQGEDADAAQSELRRHFLHGRLRALAAFLAIQRQRHTDRRRAGGANDFDGFADGGAGGDHVIDDDHAALAAALPTMLPPSP